MEAAAPADAVEMLASAGFALLAKQKGRAEDLREAERRLSPIGKAFRVFKRHPMWKPLGVDLTRPLGASSGVGKNSLHVDCVNMEHPPRLVALHCIRSDPLGGGSNCVSPSDVLWNLPGTYRHELSLPQFDEGQAFDLVNVGACLRDFPVLPESRGGWIRFSGRFVDRAERSEVRTALKAAESALEAQQVSVLLHPGQTLVVDQFRCLHGRDPLGAGQQNLNPKLRRLIVQCYLQPAAWISKND